jgi:hypothetical protein
MFPPGAQRVATDSPTLPGAPNARTERRVDRQDASRQIDGSAFAADDACSRRMLGPTIHADVMA